MRTRMPLKTAAMRSLLIEAPWPLLMSISALAWVAMIYLERGGSSAAFCLAPVGAEFERGWRAFRLALVQFSPLQVTTGWMLMLLAMMTPLLARPLRHVWNGSLTSRRVRAIAWFVLAYLFAWLLVAQLLSMLALALYAVEVAIGVPTLLSVLLVTLIWQASPAKQYCLNRCHQLQRLSAFGWAADRDALRFGLSTAAWCICTCWALMLLPMVAGSLHLPLMVLVAAIVIVERLRPARPCRWQWPRLLGLR